ncbi:hypothetical protein PVK06_039420 [Gossypium arboreum]|uniref:Protein kinase domain-containing protein n=1 Tax=Gossypium arboreum TaxID=29729 RepID=A0ABR0N318_GOSAR|nr:hypothetical protein PVK06_039420 [Gossypium arboreum]
MIFEFTAKHMLSYEPEKSSDTIALNLSNFLEGLMAFPISVPGTAFYRCKKRQQKVIQVISKLVEERMNSGEGGRISKTDFLDQIMEDMRTESFLTKEFATHVLFGILLASFEIVSSTIALAINEANILGKCGFGIVYKGVLHDGTQIAVKRMECVGEGTKGMAEFQAEIAVLSKVRHLVAL